MPSARYPGAERASALGVEAGSLDAYLDRLGIEPEPPSVAALHRLHRAHVERVPYETTWIHLGEAWTVDPAASLRRIAHDGRGGYCFHLNGAFSVLLGALGYAVTLHAGGVHGSAGPTPESIGNHLVLVVHDLETDDSPDGSWYVDVGLGDALWGAVPLRPGTVAHDPRTLSLERCVPQSAAGELADWQLTHDEAGAFAGMVFQNRAVSSMGAFASMHRTLSVGDESHFGHSVIVQRRDRDSISVLKGRSLTTTTASGSQTALLADHDAWTDVATALFGLDLRTAAGHSHDRLRAAIDRFHPDQATPADAPGPPGGAAP